MARLALHLAVIVKKPIQNRFTGWTGLRALKNKAVVGANLAFEDILKAMLIPLQQSGAPRGERKDEWIDIFAHERQVRGLNRG